MRPCRSSLRGDECMAFKSLSSATDSLNDHSHRALGSSNVTSFASKQRGSNEPPTHSNSSPPRGLPGFLMARRNSAYPLGPPQSSGGHAPPPSRQTGDP